MRLVRGTKDLLPNEYSIHEQIIETARKIGHNYGYQSMSTPIIEYTEVFNRTLGETSDIVGKEMYSFPDRGGESVTMRPEFTAGIMRSVITNNLQQELPLRFFSSGPVFRYDRPQAGRQRQFHQINFELIGDNTPYSDAEILKLASDILQSLGISEFITLEINSLGCSTTRQNYQVKLVEYFNLYYNDLSEDSKNRLHKNPMRILDSKSEQDKKIAETAPIMSDFYTVEAKTYFDRVLEMLNKLEVSYQINSKLVRGLDYYSHTAFEFTTDKLGAQSTVLAGGRYDGLANIMSNKHNLPAIGFAAGVERLALLSNITTKIPHYLAIIPIDEKLAEYSYQLASRLRQEQIPTLIYPVGKVGKRIEKSFKDGCNFALFIGEDEINSGNFQLKNLVTSETRLVTIEELIIVHK